MFGAGRLMSARPPVQSEAVGGMNGLRLIVGLGNPGAKYLRNRHNVGFWLVDAMAQQAGTAFARNRKGHGSSCRVSLGSGQVELLKPATYMNKSGIAVASALQYYKIEPEACLVVHDDLDLPPGAARFKFDGGHGGQNGMRDIMRHLGHGRFHRLRLGIGHPGQGGDVTRWVLGRPSGSDEDAIIDALAHALDVLPLAVDGNFDEARKRLHSRRP